MYRDIRLAPVTGANGVGRISTRSPYRPVAGLDALLHRMATAFGHWHRRHGAIRELRRFDNQTLNDLGIERDRIAEVVDGMLARRVD